MIENSNNAKLILVHILEFILSLTIFISYSSSSAGFRLRLLSFHPIYSSDQFYLLYYVTVSTSANHSPCAFFLFHIMICEKILEYFL